MNISLVCGNVDDEGTLFSLSSTNVTSVITRLIEAEAPLTFVLLTITGRKHNSRNISARPLFLAPINLHWNLCGPIIRLIRAMGLHSTLLTLMRSRDSTSASQHSRETWCSKPREGSSWSICLENRNCGHIVRSRPAQTNSRSPCTIFSEQEAKIHACYWVGEYYKKPSFLPFHSIRNASSMDPTSRRTFWTTMLFGSQTTWIPIITATRRVWCGLSTPPSNHSFTHSPEGMNNPQM